MTEQQREADFKWLREHADLASLEEEHTRKSWEMHEMSGPLAHDRIAAGEFVKVGKVGDKIPMDRATSRPDLVVTYVAKKGEVFEVTFPETDAYADLYHLKHEVRWLEDMLNDRNSNWPR